MKNKNDLCIQCGICASICPMNCISMQKEGYDYLPKIGEDCISCGLCQKVCPMQNLCENYNQNESIEKSILGDYKKILSVKAKDKQLLKNSASGGAITQIVKTLLQEEKYDKAFLLEGYSYEEQLATKPFDKNNDLTQTAKSRYLTVSHKNTCDYMLNNPNERIIIVGTGCVINGIKNFIQLKKLNKDNYLFLGLICDKTMNYGLYEYFKDNYNNNKCDKLKKFYFKIKENGGWPGGVRLVGTNEEFIDIDIKERMRVKDYFMPECCLYCLNKLNSNADIVFGDNYMKAYEDIEGKSVVLIRKDIGAKIFELVSPAFEIVENNEKEFLESIHLNDREFNIACAKQKGIIAGNVKKKYKKQYKEALRQISLGDSENVYKTVQHDLKIKKIKKILKAIPKNIFSVKNKTINNVKHKYLVILGIKIKIK